MLIYLNRRRMRMKRWLVAAMAAAAGGAAIARVLAPSSSGFAAAYWMRISTSVEYVFSETEGLLSGRVASWQAVLGFLAQHPWHALFGIGYKTLPYSDYLGHTVITDNMYLSLLAETGIVGLAAMIWFGVQILRAARARPPHRIPVGASSGTGSCILGGRNGRRCSPATYSPIGACCRCISGCWRPRFGMNILCLDQFGELGGAQRCLLELIPAMTNRGWRVCVAAPSGELVQRAAESGVETSTLRCGPYASGRKTPADMVRFAVETPRLARDIGRLTKRFKTDLIYVNGPRVLPAAALAARRGIRILFHSHSWLEGVGLRLAGHALQTSDARVVAACRFVAAPLEKYCGGHGVRVIYNGVQAKPVKRPARGAGELRAGVIGRISPEKGQALFLQAARLLHETSPHWRFVICGAPLFADPEAMRYSAELDGLADGLPVEFTGWTDNVESVLARLDLLVVPSAAVDATPRVILEAFAAGVPVRPLQWEGFPKSSKTE